MTLSPFEIERSDFGRAPFGYKPRDVDQFLEEVHRSLSQLWQERGEAREENEILKERLARFEQMEDQLKSTLLLAQESAEKAHEQARRESDLVMREAGQKARDIVHHAHEDKQRVEMVLRDLFSTEQEARQRLRTMAGAILSHLDDTEQLVQDGSERMRKIIQPVTDTEPRIMLKEHPSPEPEATNAPQSTESKNDLTRDEQAQKSQAELEDAEAIELAPFELKTEIAQSAEADAFFDAPPTFDPNVVTKRKERSTTEVETDKSTL